jgi:hypothetical protein
MNIWKGVEVTSTHSESLNQLQMSAFSFTFLPINSKNELLLQ